MQSTANARFAIKSWDEKPYSEGKDLPRLTRATVTKTFTGDIEGEGQVEYLMMYGSDGSATFVGLDAHKGHDKVEVLFSKACACPARLNDQRSDAGHSGAGGASRVMQVLIARYCKWQGVRG